jgi:tol-pal system protein YbgF
MEVLMKIRLNFFVTVGLLFFYSAAFADAQVVDATPTGFSSTSFSEDVSDQALPKVVRVSDGEQPKHFMKNADKEALLEKISSLQQTVQDLRVLIEEQEKEINQLQSQQDSLKTELKSQVNIKPPAVDDLETVMPVPSHHVAKNKKMSKKKIVTEHSTLPADELAYQAAYSFVKTQQYAKGIQAFKGFIKTYPQSVEVGSAYYWLAQLQSVSGDAQNAVNNFVIVAQRYPKNKNAPEAMLKLGLFAADQKQIPQAQAWFNKVVQLYPDSGEAHVAEVKLQQIGAIS